MRLPHALFLLPLLVTACAKPQVYTFTEPLMHTKWDFSLVAGSQSQAQAAEQDAATLIHQLDETLAMWKPESELSRANLAAEGPQGVTVSAELATVIGLSLQAAKGSDGSFDPTVGPLTQAWYDARQDHRLLSAAEIGRILPAVGWQKVAWDPAGRRLRFSVAGMRLDFGGIAKGYAQDRAAEVLRAHGIHDFLQNAGGQVYAAGKKPDGSPWKVGLVHPRDPNGLAAILTLSDQVMATSGDYEQYTMIRGHRVHHLLDPRSGEYVMNGVCSATSILPLQGRDHPATWADIHGKPVFVLGAKAGLEYLKREGAEGVILVDTGHGLTGTTTAGLAGLALTLQ
ncbi:MAG TPA: FAD:protein FMN transferase [bacterium]|jgi:thiamine biosynthesis lipoprotein|nr:FAD:protein FMN transferase [bacterium]